MDIKIITGEMFTQLLNSSEETYDGGYEPKGLYIFRIEDKVIAVDNSTRDAWIEEFKDVRTAVAWLRGEFEVDEIDSK